MLYPPVIQKGLSMDNVTILEEGNLVALERDGQVSRFHAMWLRDNAWDDATRRAVEFPHTLEDFFTVFLHENMQLQAFREFEGIPWKMFTRMVENPEDGQHYFPKGQPALPMGFAMKWIKPS